MNGFMPKTQKRSSRRSRPVVYSVYIGELDRSGVRVTLPLCPAVREANGALAERSRLTSRRATDTDGWDEAGVVPRVTGGMDVAALCRSSTDAADRRTARQAAASLVQGWSDSDSVIWRHDARRSCGAYALGAPRPVQLAVNQGRHREDVQRVLLAHVPLALGVPGQRILDGPEQPRQQIGESLLLALIRICC